MAYYQNGDHKQGSAPAYSPATPLNQNPPGVYGAYQPVHPVPVVYVPPPIVPVVVVPGPRRSCGSLICKIFTWTIILIVGPHILASLWRHRHHIHHGHHWDIFTSAPSDDNGGVPEDVHLSHCVEATEWEVLPKTEGVLIEPSGDTSAMSDSSASQVFFSLPLDSDALFFLSKGRLSIGLVNVTTSPDQTHDAATVRVIVNYYKEEVRDSAKVCQITREKGENGVGIFTPRNIPWPRKREDRLYFRTIVTLPETANSHTLIKKLETDVENTFHFIDDIGTKALFDAVQLVGSNGGVYAKSLTTKGLDVKTVNGVIEGLFNATDNVFLETENWRINVDVGLRATKDNEPALALLHTNNAPLQARFTLLASESGGSAFNITTNTSNSPLKVEFPAAPVNSKLHYKGRTANSPASVSLNPAYEGTFDVKTSLFSATVSVDTTVQDPTGKGRSRDVLVYGDRSRRQTTGYARWGDEDPETLGSVELTTTIMEAKISL